MRIRNFFTIRVYRAQSVPAPSPASFGHTHPGIDQHVADSKLLLWRPHPSPRHRKMTVPMFPTPVDVLIPFIGPPLRCNFCQTPVGIEDPEAPTTGKQGGSGGHGGHSSHGRHGGDTARRMPIVSYCSSCRNVSESGRKRVDGCGMACTTTGNPCSWETACALVLAPVAATGDGFGPSCFAETRSRQGGVAGESRGRQLTVRVSGFQCGRAAPMCS